MFLKKIVAQNVLFSSYFDSLNVDIVGKTINKKGEDAKW